MPMVDPHDGLISFQQGLKQGILQIGVVPPHDDLYSHFDMPTPGAKRMTYVRLADDRITVTAFVSCIFNGEIEGIPCVALGYAVPEEFRGRGFAKRIVKDVLVDTQKIAAQSGLPTIYVEAVVGVDNIASQRVAANVFGVQPERITDSFSGEPADMYILRLGKPAN